MKSRSQRWLIPSLLALCAFAHALPATAQTCGVLELTGGGKKITKNVVVNITSLIVSEVDIQGDFEFTMQHGADEFDNGCPASSSCLNKFAGDNGYQRLIVGSVTDGAADTQFKLKLRLFDPADSSYERTVTEEVQTSPESMLTEIPPLVSELLTGERPRTAADVAAEMAVEDDTPALAMEDDLLGLDDDDDDVEYDFGDDEDLGMVYDLDLSEEEIRRKQEEERLRREEEERREEERQAREEDERREREAAEREEREEEERREREAADRRRARDDEERRDREEAEEREREEDERRARAAARREREAEEERRRYEDEEEEDEDVIIISDTDAILIGDEEDEDDGYGYGRYEDDEEEDDEDYGYGRYEDEEEDEEDYGYGSYEDEDDEDDYDYGRYEDEDDEDDYDSYGDDYEDDYEDDYRSDRDDRRPVEDDRDRYDPRDEYRSSGSSRSGGRATYSGDSDLAHVCLKASVGGAYYYQGFFSYGGDIGIHVHRNVLIDIQFKGWTAGVPTSQQEQNKVATLIPLAIGASYKGMRGVVHPYIGGDAVFVLYYVDPNIGALFAPGFKVRGGADFKITESFGFFVGMNLGFAHAKRIRGIDSNYSETQLIIDGGAGIMIQL